MCGWETTVATHTRDDTSSTRLLTKSSGHGGIVIRHSLLGCVCVCVCMRACLRVYSSIININESFRASVLFCAPFESSLFCSLFFYKLTIFFHFFFFRNVMNDYR